MIEIKITVNLLMQIVDSYTEEELDKDSEQKVLNKLQKGEYIIAIHNQTIVAADNVNYVLYKLVLSGEQAEFDY